MSIGGQLNNVFVTGGGGYAKASPHLIMRVTQPMMILATASLVAAASTACYAQDLATEQETFRTEREDWQARVNASRKRIGLMRCKHRSFLPPTADEIAEAASLGSRRRHSITWRHCINDPWFISVSRGTRSRPKIGRLRALASGVVRYGTRSPRRVARSKGDASPRCESGKRTFRFFVSAPLPRHSLE